MMRARITNSASGPARRAPRAAVAAAVVLAAAAATPVPAASGQSLRDVLARTGEYAVAYGTALAAVVADEDFVQELLHRDGVTVVGQRRLQSEIAFVRLPHSIEWLAFRNVLRVDGAAVPSAPGDLERVFRDARGSALGQARAITEAGARYHLGPIMRTFNVPTTVLHFVLPQHQERFRFRKRAEELVNGERVWVIDFREQDRATFIRTPQGRSAPSEGRLWVAPEDGRLLRSRLVVAAEVRAEIDVAWRRDDRLELWVPSEMREHYRASRTDKRNESGDAAPDVRGVATYSNYRRFAVDVRIVR